LRSGCETARTLAINARASDLRARTVIAAGSGRNGMGWRAAVFMGASIA
jgi:hypothetical protein